MPPQTKYVYKKEQKVGEGQYAIVYLGRQSQTDRKVAIKSIKIGQFKDGKPPLRLVNCKEWICLRFGKSNTCKNYGMRILQR